MHEYIGPDVPPQKEHGLGGEAGGGAAAVGRVAAAGGVGSFTVALGKGGDVALLLVVSPVSDEGFVSRTAGTTLEGSGALPCTTVTSAALGAGFCLVSSQHSGEQYHSSPSLWGGSTQSSWNGVKHLLHNW